MKTSLAHIVRGFGIEPDTIRFVAGRQNYHWRVRAGGSRYALRRHGAWPGVEGDMEWELAVVSQWAEQGLPVPGPIAPPRIIDGATWFIMPWMEGRQLHDRPRREADDERLGELLAELHEATAELPSPAQRPGWGDYCDGAFPLAGGAARRSELLTEAAKLDRGVADKFARAADALEARELPRVFADYPRHTIHADFAPWNVRLRQGKLTGLLDFELAHIGLRAADVAQSRRGAQDGVVRGYLRRASLTEVELANLDAFWLASLMVGVWRGLEQQLSKGPLTDVSFPWTLSHLDIIRPYEGAPRPT